MPFSDYFFTEHLSKSIHNGRKDKRADVSVCKITDFRGKDMYFALQGDNSMNIRMEGYEPFTIKLLKG